MSKVCCLIALSLLASMAVFLYSSNNLNFIDNLSSMERQKWLEYNNQRKKQGLNALIMGSFIALFIVLVLNNKSLPVP